MRTKSLPKMISEVMIKELEKYIHTLRKSIKKDRGEIIILFREKEVTGSPEYIACYTDEKLAIAVKDVLTVVNLTAQYYLKRETPNKEIKIKLKTDSEIKEN